MTFSTFKTKYFSWTDRLTPLRLGAFFALLLFIRNAALYWGFAFAFYPDSNLYTHLGAQFFSTWKITNLVTYPYALLNALTGSYADPRFLLWLQLAFSALVGGFFVYAAARRDRLFGALAGLFLLADLVWGSFMRAILTDGMFATLNLLGLALLLYHYDRWTRRSGGDPLPTWELLLAGFVYGLIACFRPSNIFLAALFPFIYLWLTRSWKKTLALTAGLALFFASMGLINLKGSGQFYILAGDDSGTSYTNQYLAFPLFVYHLYNPQNGPASAKLDQALQACYPGLDYASAVDRSEAGGFNSTKNNDFIYQQVFPCLVRSGASQAGLVRSAYLESLSASPVHFTQVMAQEVAVFLRYANPFLLRLHFDTSKNYACSDMRWCSQINQPTRLEWSAANPLVSLYEKAASKALQYYLSPIGLLSPLLPDPEHLPYLVSWVACLLFLLAVTRGQNRFLTLTAAGLVAYTAAVVVASLGFNERYAAMLSPVQAVFSALFWLELARFAVRLVQRLRRKPGAQTFASRSA